MSQDFNSITNYRGELSDNIKEAEDCSLIEELSERKLKLKGDLISDGTLNSFREESFANNKYDLPFRNDLPSSMKVDNKNGRKKEISIGGSALYTAEPIKRSENTKLSDVKLLDASIPPPTFR